MVCTRPLPLSLVYTIFYKRKKKSFILRSFRGKTNKYYMTQKVAHFFSFLLQIRDYNER